MSPLEIIFVVAGVILLISSCFIVGRKDNEDAEPSNVFPIELTSEQKQKMEEEINRLLEEKTEAQMVKTDDYLSKISNEKIMTVNDFTEQILEKIEANHKEVVFLYDMLGKKEEEIKTIVQELESEKKELKEAVKDVAMLTKQLSTLVKRSEDKAAKKTSNKEEAKAAYHNEAKADETIGRGVSYGAERNESAGNSSKASKNKKHVQKTDQNPLPEMMKNNNKNEEILKLYRQGKNILDISKELGLGQGEVKLVIGLYGIN